jgi:hypothetical protein
LFVALDHQRSQSYLEQMHLLQIIERDLLQAHPRVVILLVDFPVGL